MPRRDQHVRGAHLIPDWHAALQRPTLMTLTLWQGKLEVKYQQQKILKVKSFLRKLFLQECAQKEGCPSWHRQIMLPVMDTHS